MKKLKNRWLVTFCALILVLGTVGVVNAATTQSGQNYQQTIANWIANDPNPMPMNMNTNMNTDPATTSNTTQAATNSTQPAADNAQPATGNTQPASSNAQSAASTTGQNGQQSAPGSQQNSQSPAPAKKNDLYNQMLQTCLQMGGQMAQYCPMLNGSNLTPDEMIKICLQMNGQMTGMSQQDLAAMQQACLQWYQQGQNANWNAQGAYGKVQNASRNNAVNSNYTTNWGYKNASGKWSGMGGHCW